MNHAMTAHDRRPAIELSFRRIARRSNDTRSLQQGKNSGGGTAGVSASASQVRSGQVRSGQVRSGLSSAAQPPELLLEVDVQALAQLDVSQSPRGVMTLVHVVAISSDWHIVTSFASYTPPGHTQSMYALQPVTKAANWEAQLVVTQS
jgi:hypothetical protein